MTQPKDDAIETRATELARADGLQWVTMPSKPGRKASQAAASNDDRARYRDRARALLASEASPPGTIDLA